MKDKQYLLCPNPVMASETVRKALFHPDMCHRAPSFENVIQHQPILPSISGHLFRLKMNAEINNTNNINK